MNDTPPYPGMPRWVKRFGILLGLLILLFIILLHGRRTAGGPGLHGSRRGADAGETAPAR